VLALVAGQPGQGKAKEGSEEKSGDVQFLSGQLSIKKAT
jgi:hypothetical protein